MSRELTNKQKAFIREYVKDFNATKSAVKAGYSKNSAMQRGHELLAKTLVRQEIEKYVSRADDGVDRRRKAIITKTTDMMNADILDLYDLHQGELIVKNLVEVPRGVRDLIQEITTINLPDGAGLGCKIKLIPRDRIISLNAKIHGMLIDKHELKVDHKVTLTSCLQEMDERQGQNYIEAHPIQE
jgi:phage terminase small subunit|tara:strand:- start:80 stop:634 length:555 start_codon:yes stop_codon:yes gene_type:complete